MTKRKFSLQLCYLSLGFQKKSPEKKVFLFSVNTSYEYEIKPTQKRKMTIEKLRHHSFVDVVEGEMCRTSETRSEGIQTTKLCLPRYFYLPFNNDLKNQVIPLRCEFNFLCDLINISSPCFANTTSAATSDDDCLCMLMTWYIFFFHSGPSFPKNFYVVHGNIFSFMLMCSCQMAREGMNTHSLTRRRRPFRGLRKLKRKNGKSVSLETLPQPRSRLRVLTRKGNLY